MRVFIVHAHPEPHSFSAAMTQTACEALAAAGHEVVVSDLYAMNFDPVSDRRNFTTVKDPNYFKQQAEELYAAANQGFAPAIKDEMDKLDWCDTLIFQFPLWWFGLPAILKGWCDRTLAMGRNYGGAKWYDNGVHRGKRALLACTTGGPASTYGPDGLNGDLQMILYPVSHGILNFIGFEVVPTFTVYMAARLTDEQRQSELERYRDYLLNLRDAAPIPYPPLSAFDERFVLKK